MRTVSAATASPTTRRTSTLAFDRGALGTAALLVGLGQAMLDLTVGYVKERQQFGVPIGSLPGREAPPGRRRPQELAFARPAVYRAAWSVATPSPTRRATCRWPRRWRPTRRRSWPAQALQCHGAIGYTVEYDLHLYLKRTWALGRAPGATSRLAPRPQSAPPSTCVIVTDSVERS